MNNSISTDDRTDDNVYPRAQICDRDLKFVVRTLVRRNMFVYWKEVLFTETPSGQSRVSKTSRRAEGTNGRCRLDHNVTH